MRLSRITMMPRSVLVRIRRPTPWRSLRIASGKEYSVNGSPRCARPLHEKIHVVFHKKFLHRASDVLHVAVICEKDKGAPIGLFDEMRNPSLQFFLISGSAWVGHLLDNEHFHLPLEIERTAELERLGFGRAGALTKIGQIGPTYGQRGAGHDATTALAK